MGRNRAATRNLPKTNAVTVTVHRSGDQSKVRSVVSSVLDAFDEVILLSDGSNPDDVVDDQGLSFNDLFAQTFPDRNTCRLQDEMFLRVYVESPHTLQLHRDAESRYLELTASQRRRLHDENFTSIQDVITLLMLTEELGTNGLSTNLAPLHALTPLAKFHTLRTLFGNRLFSNRITAWRLLICDCSASPRPPWLTAYLAGRIDANEALCHIVFRFVMLSDQPQAPAAFQQCRSNPAVAFQLWEHFTTDFAHNVVDSAPILPVVVIDHAELMTTTTGGCALKPLHDLAAALPPHRTCIALFNRAPPPCGCTTCESLRQHVEKVQAAACSMRSKGKMEVMKFVFEHGVEATSTSDTASRHMHCSTRPESQPTPPIDHSVPDDAKMKAAHGSDATPSVEVAALRDLLALTNEILSTL